MVYNKVLYQFNQRMQSAILRTILLLNSLTKSFLFLCEKKSSQFRLEFLIQNCMPLILMETCMDILEQDLISIHHLSIL